MVDKLEGSLIGRYKLIREIGRGGTSVVYLAEQQDDIRRTVAVKVMRVDPVESPEYVQRFKREARTIARLEHLHILKLYDYGSLDNDHLLYLVTPLMTGNLKDRLLTHGVFSLDEVITLLDKIGSALHFAHEKGVIHRDVNPRNILLDENDEPYLSDFGLARSDEGQQITKYGTMAGTRAYMPPEQWVGEELDRRCDIYSLGVTLFELLSGELPFQAANARELALQHLQQPPPSLSTLAPHVPRAVETVIFRALEKQPVNRYATVEEMINAFKLAARSKPEPPPATSTPSAGSKKTPDEDGTKTFVPPGSGNITDPDVVQREEIAFTFDLPRSSFNTARFLSAVTGALVADYPDLSIEILSVRESSTILTLAMSAPAAAALFARTRQQPELFAEFRLVQVSFRGEVVTRSVPPLPRPRMKSRKLLQSPVAVVLIGVALVILLGVPTVLGLVGSASVTPTPPPTAITPVLVTATGTVPPAPTAIATATDTATPTERPTATDTLTASATPTATPTDPPTATVTPTASATPEPSATATPAPVLIPSLQAGLATFMAQSRVLVGNLLSLIPTPLLPSTYEPTRFLNLPLTSTPHPQQTPTSTSTPTRTSTATPTRPGGGPIPPSSTARPTATPQPTATPPPTDTPVPPTTDTPVPPPTDTPVPPPTNTPEPTLPPTDVPKAVCGDGVCGPGENKNKCPEDCPG